MYFGFQFEVQSIKAGSHSGGGGGGPLRQLVEGNGGMPVFTPPLPFSQLRVPTHSPGSPFPFRNLGCLFTPQGKPLGNTLKRCA